MVGRSRPLTVARVSLPPRNGSGDKSQVAVRPTVAAIPQQAGRGSEAQKLNLSRRLADRREIVVPRAEAAS